MKSPRASSPAKKSRASAQAPKLNDWYEKCFRRILVDMHIPEWDERFLSKLDADTYVKTVAKGNSEGIMLYCNSHVGPTLYPSKLGPVHRAIGKGDFVGDVLKVARRKNLSVVAYYSAVYNNAAFLEHPEWRIIPQQGESPYESSRYGTCCPNSPYRDFAVAQTEELCARYDFDGIFFDMLFWPYACYCAHCSARFAKEEGGSIPTVIDWNNPKWMAYQRARERWMSELAGLLTAAVRRTRPSMTVTHQLSPVLHGWRTAMPYSLTEHCDYASGDFYGPPIQQSVVCKIFEAISVRKPFEFMTSRCLDLWDHVTMKEASEMEMQSFLAPAHGGAFMFIDAIDPAGTLNPRVYDRIGGIFPKLAPYEKYLGGNLAADVAIYVSSESRFDFRENGTSIGDSSKRADNMTSESGLPHLAAVFGAARSLQEAHIPYAVVTKSNLDRLGDYRVIVLPNVLVMSDAEVEAFRSYVAGGGALYASGYSSLVSDDGSLREDFGLSDVFGVSAHAMMDHTLAFFAPTKKRLADLVLPQEHLIHRGGWIAIQNRTAKVLAELTKPWCPENGGTVLKPSFASIHSSPPALEAFAPGITWHKFGKGRACYAAGPIEAEQQKVNRPVFAGLIRRLHGGTIPVEAEAPAFVELTVFDKPSEHRLNLSLVSLRQNEEPVPCDGKVRVRLGDGRRVVALRSLPGRRKWPSRKIPGGIEFAVSGFETFSMFELEYKNL
ncbi:MAG: alpha-L-fucosidase [Terrimicrobiaceae bacterium]